jgi:hypothetical protein
MPMSFSYDVVHISWVDPHSIDSWSDLRGDQVKPSICNSVGFLTYEDDEVIAVSLSIGHVEEDKNCSMVIPKVCIKKRKRLWKKSQTPKRA